MPITLPSFVAPNELIQSSWGNAVVDALAEIDTEFVEKAGDTMTGQLTLNAGDPSANGHATRKFYVDTQDNLRVLLTGDEMTGTLIVNMAAAGGSSLILKETADSPRLRWRSQANSEMGSIIVTATSMSIDTLTNNPVIITAPTLCHPSSGSAALTLRAPTETPVLDLTSEAGTSLLRLTAGATNSTISTFDDLTLTTNGTAAVVVDGGTQNVRATADLEVDGALNHDGSTVGFYGTAPVAKQTGVAVTAGGIHAALVNLGLIT